MKKVLCIAEVCCDIIFGGLSKIPVLGEEEYCQDFSIKAGGGANTAMGLSKLNVPVSMFTKIGDDEFGKIVYQHLITCGMSEDFILLEKDTKTAVSAVMSTNKDRCFASFMGSGKPFLEQMDQLEEAIRKADHVHTFIGYCIHSPIVELCRKHKKTLSVDTSWIPEMKLEELIPIVSYCTFFTPNEKEAMELTKTNNPEEALLVLSRYAKGTIVTLGEKGSITMLGNEVYYQPCISYGVTKDTTGAGDLYCSGLIYGFVNGADKKESMRMASHTSGYSVTYYGGMDASFDLKKLNL